MAAWQPVIAAGGATCAAFEAWAQERILHHLVTCSSTAANEAQIRLAQGAIAELRVLLALRDTLKTETIERAQAADNRRGY